MIANLPTSQIWKRKKPLFSLAAWQFYSFKGLSPFFAWAIFVNVFQPNKVGRVNQNFYPTLKIEFIDGIKFIGHKCANKLSLCKKLTQVKKDQKVDLKKTFNKKEKRKLKLCTLSEN
jgi:hypothetical protein